MQSSLERNSQGIVAIGIVVANVINIISVSVIIIITVLYDF